MAILIPARLNSSRLPGKPLLKFNGLPMIVAVAKKCAEVFDPKHIFVLTPDQEIINSCTNFQIQVVKTSSGAKSGTDRIAEFSRDSIYDNFLNVQGDELLLSRNCLQDFIMKAQVLDSCVVGIAKIKTEEEFNQSSIVKVAVSNGKMIYASRSAIPFGSFQVNFPSFKHTGLYKFSRESLESFASLEQGPLETIEKIEILRFIENRIPVNIVEVKNYLFTIDTLQDELTAREILKNINL
jgi:3-deoxy-manno-octulosonate cytidylyltransferase (CMP-KDO synthetase)